MSAATQINGFEWRVLLGPVHSWTIPDVEPSQEKMATGERCELCGELIGEDKPFMTNSAGQQPMHIACLGAEEPAVIELRPARKPWLRLLQSFGSG